MLLHKTIEKKTFKRITSHTFKTILDINSLQSAQQIYNSFAQQTIPITPSHSFSQIARPLTKTLHLLVHFPARSGRQITPSLHPPLRTRVRRRPRRRRLHILIVSRLRILLENRPVKNGQC